MEANQSQADAVHNIYDCIVIGGGISGVTFAHFMYKADKKVLIVEKGDRMGGQIYTHYSTVRKGYWGEMGAHTCYNSYTNLLKVVDAANCRHLIQPLDKFNYVLHDSDKMRSILSGLSILSLSFSGTRLFVSKKEGKTAREFFRPIVGARNYDRIIRNAFRAVISQNPDDYPAEIFLKKRKDRDKSLPRRFTFKAGLSSFVDTIIGNDRLDVKTSCEIKAIAIDASSGQRLYVLQGAQGEKLYAKNIAIAADPQSSARLLGDIEPAVSALLSDIKLFESETLNVIVPKDRLTIDNIAGIIPMSDDFMSAVSRDLVEDEQLRSFAFHFEKGAKSPTEKMDIVCRTLNVSQNDIIEKSEAAHVLPAMRVNHLHLAEKAEAARLNEDLYLIGNYYYGLSLEDCVNRSLVEFDRFLSNEQA